MHRFAAFLICAAFTSTLRAENWPQWRGPTCDGISTETPLPVEWSAEKNILFTLDLPGMGSSTPAVWGDRLFLTSEAGSDIVLMAVGTTGASRGKILWRHPFGSATAKARNDEGNGASASPCTDGKFVWAFAGSGELVCCDFAGTEIWKMNLQKQYGKFDNQFGMHSTPVLHDGHLYLQLIHSGAAWVVKLEAATGKEVWKINRKSDGRAENEHSYASPVLWTDGTNAYLVTHGNDYAIAHDLEDGHEIWRLGDLNPKSSYNPALRFVASPVAVKDLIVVPTAKSGPVVGVKPSATGMIRAGGAGEHWRMSRNTPDVPSPLVHDGLVYLCRETGVLICLDAKNGKELYSQRTHTGRYRASPVYGDGKIYLTCRDGTVTVVQAGAEFKSLATNRLPVQVSASPAISDGVIYLHGFEKLYAIGRK